MNFADGEFKVPKHSLDLVISFVLKLGRIYTKYAEKYPILGGSLKSSEQGMYTSFQFSICEIEVGPQCKDFCTWPDCRDR